jgi:hypothetical protein
MKFNTVATNRKIIVDKMQRVLEALVNAWKLPQSGELRSQ